MAGDDQDIKEEYLSERIKGAADQKVGSDEIPTTIQEATARVERKMVADALRRTGGNRTQAARILGITRQGLLNKIGRYEIKL